MPGSGKTRVNQRLREARIRRRWSQQELAERVGTTFNNVSRWERGITTPGAYFRTRLCDLFDQSAEALGLLPAASDRINSETQLYDPAIPPPRRLIGRTVLMRQIRQQLCTAAPVERLALHGLPGVGKTALAIALVHDRELQEQFRDGILWVGLGPQPNIPALLGRWGALLGIAVAESVQTGGPDAWALALRMAIGKRHMLLVLDDVWRLEDALALQVAGPHCSYLLTTRFPVRRRAGVQSVRVERAGRYTPYVAPGAPGHRKRDRESARAGTGRGRASAGPHAHWQASTPPGTHAAATPPAYDTGEPARCPTALPAGAATGSSGAIPRAARAYADFAASRHRAQRSLSGR